MKEAVRRAQLLDLSFKETPEKNLSTLSENLENKSHKVDQAIEERKRLENQALAQDIALKRFTLYILFSFLAIETLIIFIYAFFQAVHSWGFKLEDWSFRLLIAATITQITLMVQVAVKHLFPTPKESS